VQAVQDGNLLHRLLPLTTGEVAPMQFVVRPPPAETLTQAEYRVPDLFARRGIKDDGSEYVEAVSRMLAERFIGERSPQRRGCGQIEHPQSL
jgi:hypothetical protein